METVSGGVNWHSGNAFLPMQRLGLGLAGRDPAEVLLAFPALGSYLRGSERGEFQSRC